MSFIITPEEADSGANPAALARRRRVAEALLKQGMGTGERPMRSWTQGAAKIAQALTGGYLSHKADEEEKSERAKAGEGEAAMWAQLLGGSRATEAPTVPGDPTPPSPASGGFNFAPRGGAPLSPNERVIQAFSALDPTGPSARVDQTFKALAPSGADLDNIVRTVVGEAGSESPDGQRAVASVIQERANAGRMSPTEVVKAPNQFEPWGNPKTRARLEAMDPNSPMYQKTLANIMPMLTHEVPSPVPGADHFYSPTAQSALGRQPPKWDDGSGVDLGRHRFFDHDSAQPRGAAVPPALAAIQQAAKPGSTPAAALPGPVAEPQAAPAAFGAPQTAAATPAQVPGQAPGMTEAGMKIMKVLQNPYSSAGSKAVAAQMLSKLVTPTEYGYQEVGGSLYRTDPRKGTAEVVIKGAPKLESVAKGSAVIDPTTGREIYRNQPKVGPGGVVLDEDIRKASNELRDEFNTSAVKPFVGAREGYQKVLAAAEDQSAAGDIALIFGYMKTLDPSSTVREGEFATAQNAGGVSDKVANAYNRALSGERLNPDQRQMFAQSALGQYKVAEQNFMGETERYKGLASQYGINPNLVLRTFDPVDQPKGKQPAPGQPATPKTQQDFDALKPGTLYIDPDDGKPYRKK